jgi:hypothetical protein
MNQIYDTYTQDPDETFKMYVERLMKAKPKFGGTFATPTQQGQDATAKATGGLLTGLFPEYADKMGGSSSDSMPSVNSGSAPSAPGARGNFASAESVLGSQQFAGQLSDMGRGLGQLGGAVLGPAGMLLGLAPKAAEYYSNNQWDSFNRGIDSNEMARAEAMGLGGLGTYSDRQGNLGTISNQALIDAYDRDTFGVGAGLDSSYYAQTYNTPDMMGPMAPSAGGGVVGGQPGVGIDSGNFDSGGGFTDMGGGSFDYSADTGYDR